MRVFSGARPTGRQHIGNYLGAIRNYAELQEEYECIYCIVDVHALTTMEDALSTSRIQSNIQEMMLDWLACGLDPQKSILFVQSRVPEVLELHTFLSMITPLGWLLRVPTFKEKVRAQPHNVNYGLVGYPVLQAADIVLYKAELVPVGEDQLPHLELAREIVRRFNNIFGYTFPEPEAKLTNLPLVLGLDGEAEEVISDAVVGKRDRPIALVLGAEGPGLRQKTKETCDALVKIEYHGGFGSLNVSNAAAVALYATSHS